MSLNLSCVDEFFLELRLRYLREVWLVSVGRIDGCPECAGLNVACDIGSVVCNSGPLRARLQNEWWPPDSSFQHWVWDYEGLSRSHSHSRPNAGKVEKRQGFDGCGCGPAIDRVNDKHAFSDMLRPIHHRHVWSGLDDYFRSALKPSAHFQRQCARGDNSRVDRHPSLCTHSHSPKQTIEGQGYARWGVVGNLPISSGTGLGRNKFHFEGAQP